MLKRSIGGLRRMFSVETFKAADLKINTVKNTGVAGCKDMTFGSTNTAHMFIADCVHGKWGTPEIMPYAPMAIDPFNSTFHYAVTCYEGMKVYLDKNGKMRLFRPDMNMKRMAIAMDRLALAPFEGSEMIKCIEEYCKIEKNWIPSKIGESLYLRPFAFSMQNTLGVKPALSSRVMIIASPVANYFGTKELTPIRLAICRDYERGTPLSAAGYKLGANYAPTIKISGDLKEKLGADQVLWLHNDKILEVGACNIFFLIEDSEGKRELVTAPLDGSILPGITRDTILKLEQEKQRVKVSERHLTITELKELSKQGKVIEIFGTGTAVCIMPIAEISSHLFNNSC